MSRDHYIRLIKKRHDEAGHVYLRRLCVTFGLDAETVEFDYNVLIWSGTPYLDALDEIMKSYGIQPYEECVKWYSIVATAA